MIEFQLREFGKDVLIQEWCTLQDAVLEGIQYYHSSEGGRRVAVYKDSIGTGSKNSTAERKGGWKSNNGRHPYGEGGAVGQIAKDVTKIFGLNLVRGLPCGDNSIRGVIEIHR